MALISQTAASPKHKRKIVFSKERLFTQLIFNGMLLPAVIFLIIFSYIPLIGVVMAFQDYKPVTGIMNSEWVGLGNFYKIFTMHDIDRVMFNTVYIACMKIIAGLIAPIVFALLLNEIAQKFFVRTVQTLVYLPYFLSWVILGGILIDILSPSTGVVNQLIAYLGFETIFFLGDKEWFPYVLVISDTWKGFGFGTIIYLAALTGIDPHLYEAAVVDGANRWKQTWHVTLPGIRPIVLLMMILSLGSILDAGFDQVYNLYNPLVYETGDILDTMVYRLGFDQAQFSISTAVGLIKSVIGFALIVVSYKLADKYAGYKIF